MNLYRAVRATKWSWLFVRCNQRSGVALRRDSPPSPEVSLSRSSWNRQSSLPVGGSTVLLDNNRHLYWHRTFTRTTSCFLHWPAGPI